MADKYKSLEINEGDDQSLVELQSMFKRSTLIAKHEKKKSSILSSDRITLDNRNGSVDYLTNNENSITHLQPNTQILEQLSEVSFQGEDLDGEEEIEMKPATLSKIVQMHRQFNINNLQAKTAKQSLRHVTQTIPINQLYEVKYSSNYQIDAKYCPVLLKIKSKDVMEDTNLPYLLQVWDDQGILVFERQLAKPVTNWNFSADVFMWQETPGSSEVYMVKVFADKPCQMYHIDMVGLTQEAGSYTTLDSSDNIIIPMEDDDSNYEAESDTHKAQELGKTAFSRKMSQLYGVDINAQFAKARMLAESNKDQNNFMDRSMTSSFNDLNESQNGKSGEDMRVSYNKIASAESQRKALKLNKDILSNHKSKKIIKRDPDKQIDYVGDYLIVAQQHKIIYIKVKELFEEEFAPGEIIKHRQIGPEEQEVVELDDDFKVVTIQEINDVMSCIVVEHLRHRYIRFLSLERITENSKQKLKISFLGLHQEETNETISRLRKYRYSIKRKENGKLYMVGILLRQNGRVEVYSDFMKVSQYYNPENPCVDIETSASDFYLKCVDNDRVMKKISAGMSENKLVNDKDIFVYLKIDHRWRNRIDISTSREFFEDQKWERILHHRIADYCKLYTKFINFSSFMLIAHRNILQVYDMRINKWKKPFHCREFIRYFEIKYNANENVSNPITDAQKQGTQSARRRGKKQGIYERFRINLFCGVNTVMIISLSQNGYLRDESLYFKQLQKCRVLSFESGNNPVKNFGILMLCDTGNSNKPLYIKKINEHSIDSIYNFALSEVPNSEIKLMILMQNKVFELVSSEFDEHQICRLDTEVSMMEFEWDCGDFVDAELVRETVQVVERRDGISEEQQMTPQYYEDIESNQLYWYLRRYIQCLYFRKCGPDNDRKAVVIPFRIKYDSKQDMKLTDITLLTDLVRYYPKISDFGSLQNVFASFDPDVDMDDNSLTVVTSEEIHLYNEDCQKQLVYKNLNIKDCMNVHQSYIYTIQNTIEEAIELEKYKRDGTLQEKIQFEEKRRPSGFYCIDADRLFQGKLEMYKMVSTIAGVNCHIDNSKFSDRFAFIQDYNKIAAIPFPHLNKLDLSGMTSKDGYLVWREKNSFMTTVDFEGYVMTWSMPTGKMLYYEDTYKEDLSQWLRDFAIYQSDKDDIAYTSDRYNFEDHSVQLLKSTQSIKEILHNIKNNPQDVSVSVKSTINKLKMEINKQQDFLEQGKIMVESDEFGTIEQRLINFEKSQIEIDFKASSNLADLYLFRVMTLQTYEDTGCQSQVDLRFQFIHPLIRQTSDKTRANYDWDVSADPNQEIHISRSTLRMLEIINNSLAILYERDEHVDDGNERLITWRKVRKMKKFPRILAQLTSLPYYFSPEFNYILDFVFIRRIFVIVDLNNYEIICEIPVDMLEIKITGLKDIDAIKVLASRICFVDEDTIRVINKENLDCILKIVDNPDKGSDQHKKVVKLQSACKLDNLFTNITEMNNRHQIVDKAHVPEQDVLENINRANQRFKSKMQMAKTDPNFNDNLALDLYYIDYTQPWNGHDSSFDVQTTFTLLDWKICELIIADPQFNVGDIDHQQKIQLALNIFPGGHSLLHKLAIGGNKNSGEQFISDGSLAMQSTYDLFQSTRKESKLNLLGVKGGIGSLEVPLIQDLKGKTALDYCLGEPRPQREWNKQVFKDKDEVNLMNLSMAQVIFDEIKDYSFMHGGDGIVDSVINAIKIDLKGIGDYLDGRLQAGKYFRSNSQRPIKRSEEIDGGSAAGIYACMNLQCWASEKLISDQLFNKDEGSIRPMEYIYLDLPFIHQHTIEGMDFLEALKTNKNMDLFSKKSVQILITKHWQRWSYFNNYFRQIPITLQLIGFWFWSNIFLNNYEEHQRLQTPTLVVEYFILAVSSYLTLIELQELKISGFYVYFQNSQKLIDIVSIVLVIYNVISRLITGKTGITFWRIQSWSALFIWLSFIIFLKSYDSYSYLVRMIQEVIKDLLPFMVIFSFAIIAFADSFSSIREILIEQNGDYFDTFIIDQGTEEESRYQTFIQGYVLALQESYTSAIGETPIIVREYNEFDWIVYFMCTFFNVIILLNLLIAIISDTFARVNETAVQTNFYEKTLQSVSIMHTFNTKKVSNPTEMLFVTRDSQETGYLVNENIDLLEKTVESLVEKNEQLSEQLLDQEMTLGEIKKFMSSIANSK